MARECLENISLTKGNKLLHNLKKGEKNMAKVVLKAGANPKKVAKRLKASGIIMTRQLADGSYVAYKKKFKIQNSKLRIKNEDI
jgi:hypothetical protein